MSGHILLFAETDDGTVGKIGLAYARSLIRLAPVRLVTMSTGLSGAWTVFRRLLETPMNTPVLAAVVCTDPSLWVRRLRIPMPKHDPHEVHVAMAGPSVAQEKLEHAERLMELRVANTRNVLVLTPSKGLSADQLAALGKYDAVVRPIPELDPLVLRQARGVTYIVPVPVTDHAALHGIVLGEIV